MIYESYPWKQDLQQWADILKKYSTVPQSNDEAAADDEYTLIEKAIFYSAFISRKLIDCKGKVSEAVDGYSIKVKCFAPIAPVDFNHRQPSEKSHDWNNPIDVTAAGRDICNWLIHSYEFSVLYNDESNLLDSFMVVSDKDKDSKLYQINIADWIKFTVFIATDDIAEFSEQYNKSKKEYVFTKKKRGKINPDID